MRVGYALRAALRACGLPVHKGWEAIHHSGYTIQCTGCGEIRQMMQSRVEGRSGVQWWETWKEGDGSCGDRKPLPERWG